MRVGESREGLRTETPPLIGRCLKCRYEILASHPYSWCKGCRGPIPCGIDMQRRPIMFGTIRVFGSGFSSPEMHPKQGTQAGFKAAVRTFLSLTHK